MDNFKGDNMKRLILITIILLSGCCTTNPSHRDRTTYAGTVLGSIIGGVIGHQLGGTASGIASGGIIGTLAGSEYGCRTDNTGCK